MTGLLYLIPIALAMGLAGLLAFLWALKSGQYEDLDGAAGRVLFDDPPAGPSGPAITPQRQPGSTSS
jgi:cbb3-type cytochrome oxidase maturation protein